MKTVDSGVERVINSLSPTNQYGNPIFRAIWSADRFHWAAGWWNDYDKQSGVLVRRVFEARWVPRYQMAHRWIIEKWMPPEFFGTPELWEAATREYQAQHGVLLELGPYPHEGDYMHLWTCQTEDGKFVEFTATLAEEVVLAAQRPIKSVAEMRAEAEAKKIALDLQFSKTLDDIIGDPFPFLGRTNNLTPSSLLTKMREERKRGRTV